MVRLARALLAEGFAPLNVFLFEQGAERSSGRVKVKPGAVAIRGAVCTALFALNAIALFYMWEDRNVSEAVLGVAEDGVECGPRDRFCTFRLLCITVACLLLLPYFVETAQLSAYVLTGSKRKIAFERPDLISREEMQIRTFPARVILAVTQLACFLAFLLISPAMMLYYLLIWGSAAAFRSSGSSSEAWAGLSTWTRLSTTIYFFTLPDLLLTISLFPLAVLVVNTSDSIPEMVVNLVAVLFFAQLDDVLVFMVLNPRRSLGQALEIYCTDEKGGSLSASAESITGM